MCRCAAATATTKPNNCIEITEIPPTTTIEAIMDKVIDLVKAGKIREIADMRDETDLSGLKITIDLKRGVDPDKLMQKLFRMTPLEDSFSCNFNVLIAGMPRVHGRARAARASGSPSATDCVTPPRLLRPATRRRRSSICSQGLEKILLDIDKAIAHRPGDRRGSGRWSPT